MTRENMFLIDLDDDANEIEHPSLILRRESAALTARRDELDKEFGKALHKSIKKDVGKMLFRLLSPLALLGLGGLLLAFEPSLLALKVVAIILMLTGAALLIYNCKKQKSKEPNEDELDEELDSGDDTYSMFNKQVKKELHVPFDAQEVEVFTTMFSKDTDKKEKTVYTNDTPSAFIEDGKLCFWYGSSVVGFPMSEIEALVKVNNPITFDSWMADAPHDGIQYAKYDIKMKEVDYEEHYTMKGYYSLRFMHEGTPFELLFPLFNADKLLKLIDREVVEE